jgi:hypothetical protein
MQAINWQTQKVFGRDEILLEIEKRANADNDAVVQDVRAVMQDYEVDMYRLVIGIGKRYGMETAYEIMSDAVAEKRLKWLDQVKDELGLSGSEVEKGLGLYLNYFRPKAGDFKVIEQTHEKVLFTRKDFVNAISHACNVLGLDVIEVNNKVYARAMSMMYERINLPLRHVFLNYQGGWYDEMIEISP